MYQEIYTKIKKLNTRNNLNITNKKMDKLHLMEYHRIENKHTSAIDLNIGDSKEHNAE